MATSLRIMVAFAWENFSGCYNRVQIQTEVTKKDSCLLSRRVYNANSE